MGGRRPHSQTARLRAVWLLSVVVAVLLVHPARAGAGWPMEGSGGSVAVAQTVPPAPAPTAMATDQEVSVSWNPITLSGGTPAAGYIVRRYDASLEPQVVLGACNAVVSNGCVEHDVPEGTWTYSVQATMGTWTGAESGLSTPVTVTAPVDITPPINFLSLADAVGAHLDGDTLYFRRTTAGSFVLVNALTDAHSGPASTTFPTFTANRWTAPGGTVATVATPIGGPYTSSAYSWTGQNNTATPPPQVVTGFDAAGNSATTTVTFVADTTQPSIVAADVVLAPVGNTTTTGWIRQGGAYHVYANATDADSGIGDMTADVRTVTAGVVAAPMTPGAYEVAGVTYGWRTDLLVADDPHGAGKVNIRVTATDFVGNARTSRNSSVEFDNTPPTGSITAPSNGWAGASTTLTSNSSDNKGVHSASFEYSVAGANSWVAIGSATVSPYSVAWDAAGLTHGATYELRVITSDLALNTFISPAVTVTLDLQAPDAPPKPNLAVASDSGALGDDVTNVANPTFVGTAEVGSTVTLLRDGTPVGTTLAVGGSWSITSANLADGQYEFTVTATDAAGNGSAPSAGAAVVIDRVRPAFTSADIHIAPVGNTTTPGFVSPGAQYHVYANPTDAGSGVATVTANVNNITTGLTAVPLVPGTYAVGGVTYSFRSEPITANQPLGNGNRSFNATATDVAGNSRGSGNRNVVVENTPPTGSITNPTNGWAGAITTVSSNSADTGSGVHDATFQWSPAGVGSWTTIGTATATPYSVSWDTTALTPGASYDLRVVTTDNAANTATSAVVTVTVDHSVPTTPSAPVLAPASDSGVQGDHLTNDTTPTLTGTAEPGTTVRIRAGGSVVGSATVTSGGAYSITTSALPEGENMLTATTVNSAGNESTPSGALILTIDTVRPTVTAVVLANGGVAGTIDTGDTGTVTFSEPINASTFCSAWSADPAIPQTLTDITVTIGDSGGNDTLSVFSPSCATGGLGTWVIGDYVGGGGGTSATFVNSVATWDPVARTMTVAIGTLHTSSTIRTGVAPRANQFTAFAALTDLAGNDVITTTFTHPTATGL